MTIVSALDVTREFGRRRVKIIADANLAAALDALSAATDVLQYSVVKLDIPTDFELAESDGGELLLYRQDKHRGDVPHRIIHTRGYAIAEIDGKIICPIKQST